MSERWRIVLAVLLATLFALFTEQWLASFGFVSIGLLVWHTRFLVRYELWLKRGANVEKTPVLFGVWADLIDHVSRIHKRHERRERQLKDVIVNLENTIGALPDSTVIMGEHGEIIWANSVAERNLGIRYPGDKGVRVSHLVRDPLFLAFLKQDEVDKSVNIPSPLDPEVHLNIRVVPYGDNAHLLTARDISELIRADAMRRDFVSNASHELKTPLTVMMGYMELLEGEVRDELKPLVCSSAEQTRRMQQLVDDLLTLSRLDATGGVQFGEVNVAAMMEAIVQEARQLSGEHAHVFELDVDHSLMLNASHKDILSAFSNLVFNAVNHTSAGTVVRISWHKEQSYSVLRVKDNGEGIAPHHLSRLTERFYRVQAGRERDTISAKQGRGTGLGLAITKHVIQAHHGYMEIDSKLGLGTEFACFFEQ